MGITILRPAMNRGDEEESRYIITCSHCNCVFQFTNEDVVSRERRLFGKRTVKCPECGKLLEFYPDAVSQPKLWRPTNG